MSDVMAIDHTRSLQLLMRRAGIASFRALSEKAGVSRWQVQQLRQGQVGQMRLAVLMKLAMALEMSLVDFLSVFEISTGAEAVAAGNVMETAMVSEPDPLVETLRQEYARLQARMVTQADELRSQLQQTALQTLESWLLQWPTAAHAATKNDQLPAKRLLPLVKPVETLVESWGVVAIATVGEEIVYDPQQHQLMDGTAQPGDLVRVRYTGYTQQGKLLYRAKVSPIR